MAQISKLCMRSFLYSRNAIHTFEYAQACKYSRWTHRRPSKVVLPEDKPLKNDNIIDLTSKYVKDVEIATGTENVKRTSDIKNQSFNKKLEEESEGLFDFEKIDSITLGENTKVKTRRRNRDKVDSNDKSENSEKKKTSEKRPIPVFDSEGQFIYDKLNYKSPLAGNILIKVKSRKSRAVCGQILVEGWRLIADGLQANCKLDMLIFSRLSELEKIRPFMPNQGIKIYKMPYNEMQMWSNLDTCPGVMGIFQTPKLLEIQRLNEVYPINIICDNVREPGNMGSILRACLGVGCDKVMLTKGCVDIWDSKVLRSAAGAHFRMPILTNMTWEDISDNLDKDNSIFIADNNLDTDLDKKKTLYESNHGDMDLNYESKPETIMNNIDKTPSYQSIPIIPYFDVNFSSMQSITVVIGGETLGISDECYKIVKDKSGVRLNVPLVKGVDSLNSCTALAIIAFEIKRQLILSGHIPEVPVHIPDHERIQAKS